MGIIGKLAALLGIHNCSDLLRFTSLRIVEGLVVILLITFMPKIPPHAKYETAFTLSPGMPLEGKLAINNKLNNAEHWHRGDFIGAESFAEFNGELYASVQSGDVIRLSGEKNIHPVAKFGKQCKGWFDEKTCGRPLGLAFDKNGHLYAADAYYGIFKVDLKTGLKQQLVSPDFEIGDAKPKLFNSVVVAQSGDIYWTDSSTEFNLGDGVFDMLADGSGRLIHYNPQTKRNTILINNLHFANGVAMSEAEDFIIVAETGRNRIHRYYLKGEKAGSSDIFIDGLPGSPDNLRSDGLGGFLVPLVIAHDSARPNVIQIFGQFPLVRKFISRLFGIAEFGFQLLDQVLPNDYAKMGQHFIGHFSTATCFINGTRVSVLHLNKLGEITQSFHADNGKIMGISEAFIYKDYLIMGSPFNDYIARVHLKQLDLSPLKVVKPVTQTPPTTTQTPPTTTTQAPPTTTTKPLTTTTQAPRTTTAKPPTQATPTTTTKPPTTTQAPPTTTTKPPTVTTKAPPTPAKTAPTIKQTPPTKAPEAKVKQTPPTPAAKQTPPIVKQAPPSATKQTTPPPPPVATKPVPTQKPIVAKEMPQMKPSTTPSPVKETLKKKTEL